MNNKFNQETNFQNILYYGDNLDILKKLVKEYPHGLVDLIYIDPPFNSNRNYNILFEDLIKNKENGEKNKALKEAFVDTWSNVNLSLELEELKSYTDKPLLYRFLINNREIFTSSQMSYLTMMAHRIYYMHKILKDTGSFYLHCDPTMSHYLKILLDIIFGNNHFKNEIVWKRTGAHNNAKRCGSIHDVIFFYTKHKDKYTWNDIYLKYNEDYIHSYFKYKDHRGVYCKENLTSPGNHNEEKDLEWRGYNPSKRGRGWYIPKKIVMNLGIEKLSIIEKLEVMYNNDYIVFSSEGTPRYKNYLNDQEGKKLQDIWDDISCLTTHNKERLGYPTQKPEKLLERIILASSNEGDIVADFFCGCGTAITVAEKLKRKWLGVDINHLAISLIEEKRLKPLKAIYKVDGFPTDIATLEKLAAEDKHKFEEWVVEYKFRGHKTKKTGDGGVDGHIAFNFGKKKLLAVIEVKGGNVTIAQIRAFKDSINKFNADFGIFVCFQKEITKGMLQEADQMGILNTQESEQLHIPFNIQKMYIISAEDLLEDKLPANLIALTRNITY